MREYVSPAELKAYADICKSVADTDAARGAAGTGNASLPPPPPRLTLDLVDLVAAEAARVEQQQKRDSEGTYIFITDPINTRDMTGAQNLSWLKLEHFITEGRSSNELTNYDTKYMDEIYSNHTRF